MKILHIAVILLLGTQAIKVPAFTCRPVVIQRDMHNFPYIKYTDPIY